MISVILKYPVYFCFCTFYYQLFDIVNFVVEEHLPGSPLRQGLLYADWIPCGVVLLVMVSSMSQLELFKSFSYLIGSWEKMKQSRTYERIMDVIP